jgi:hypothetical protein
MYVVRCRAAWPLLAPLLRPPRLHLTHATLACALLLLLHPPAPISPCIQEGATPLHLAADNGHVESVVALCEHGANKEATDKVRAPPTVAVP